MQQSWPLDRKSTYDEDLCFSIPQLLPSGSEMTALPLSSSAKSKFPSQRITANILKISSCSCCCKPMTPIAFYCATLSGNYTFSSFLSNLQWSQHSPLHHLCLRHQDNHCGLYTRSSQDPAIHKILIRIRLKSDFSISYSLPTLVFGRACFGQLVKNVKVSLVLNLTNDTILNRLVSLFLTTSFNFVLELPFPKGNL